MEPSFKYVKLREVHDPTRANEGDAGIDFYVPTNLSVSDISKANIKNEDYDSVDIRTNSNLKMEEIILWPHSRVSIPSGIYGILNPKDSMLQANNKSGISTNKGLIFSAEVVDSGYLGEIHIGIINTTNHKVIIKAGEKLVQFVHIPVYLSKPQIVGIEEYNKLKGLKLEESGRGEAGMGSGKETL